ncbi:unnamed protein product [Brassica oleracea var. botrytis]|uniref:(rape) hypothetical protein n=1 Tax=Brassica napus TaxID=3708 RepID=A0A816J5H5_BRANA|nr:unnamed protein product [Brassica napus]
MGRPRGPFKPPLNMDGRQDFHPSLPEKFDVSCVDVNRHGKEAEDSVYTHMPTRNILSHGPMWIRKPHQWHKPVNCSKT